MLAAGQRVASTTSRRSRGRAQSELSNHQRPQATITNLKDDFVVAQGRLTVSEKLREQAQITIVARDININSLIDELAEAEDDLTVGEDNLERKQNELADVTTERDRVNHSLLAKDVLIQRPDNDLMHTGLEIEAADTLAEGMKSFLNDAGEDGAAALDYVVRSTGLQERW